MKKRPREPKPLLPALASASGPALIKHLASCNTTVRSQSLRLLQSWLASQSEQLSDYDLKKLWKGLFYCLWHSDKTPNQVALINRLTSLFLSLQPSLSLEFFRGFLLTLRREWPGIDRLRLDKFYLLIRRFMKSLFELMRLMKWDVEVLGEYFAVLEKDGFLAEDKLQGNGVNYHIVSVFLEELKGVGFPVKKEVVNVILRPFLAVLLRSKDRILLGKVKGCMFDELLKVGKDLLAKKRAGVDCHENEGVVLLGVVALRMGLSVRFYEVGSSLECVQGNRKVALGLHEVFLKLEKELESSGIEIAIPEYSNASVDGVHDGEVPQLIPIENGTTIDGNVELRSQEWSDDVHKDEGESDDGSFRKSKKVKKGRGKDGDDKRAKRKKKKRIDDSEVSEINTVVKENGVSVTADGMENAHSFTASGGSMSFDLESDGGALDLNETVISNLQKQFEKVADEPGSYNDEDSDFCDTPVMSVKRSLKRKRIKVAGKQESVKLGSIGACDSGVDSAAKSTDKSAKKVRFAMKNNLVWKPQTPLPPESLRLPPSATPRGSALKKGVPPGPIIETRPVVKKTKQKKKALKKTKSATPVVKRRKKIKTLSV